MFPAGYRPLPKKVLGDFNQCFTQIFMIVSEKQVKHIFMSQIFIYFSLTVHINRKNLLSTKDPTMIYTQKHAIK